jgi:hypothetical protein
MEYALGGKSFSSGNTSLQIIFYCSFGEKLDSLGQNLSRFHWLDSLPHTLQEEFFREHCGHPFYRFSWCSFLFFLFLSFSFFIYRRTLDRELGCRGANIVEIFYVPFNAIMLLI